METNSILSDKMVKNTVEILEKRMEKKLTIVQVVIPLVIALGSIAILFALFSTWGVSSQAGEKVVKDGILDLSDWHFIRRECQIGR
jgi:flagellar basal body-associated protein FliL